MGIETAQTKPMSIFVIFLITTHIAKYMVCGGRGVLFVMSSVRNRKLNITLLYVLDQNLYTSLYELKKVRLYKFQSALKCVLLL
jgi:hypothetical protein